MNVEHISVEESFRMHESQWWLGKTSYEIAQKGLFTDKECISWRVLQKALSDVLGRHISNEDVMRNIEGLRKEFLQSR